MSCLMTTYICGAIDILPNWTNARYRDLHSDQTVRFDNSR